MKLMQRNLPHNQFNQYTRLDMIIERDLTVRVIKPQILGNGIHSDRTSRCIGKEQRRFVFS
jgi:hypothetical protein